MKRRRKKHEPVDLGEVIDRLVLTPPEGLERPPLSARQWERAVGSRIATKSKPWRLVRGVLHVRVTHSVWANELALLSDDIRRQLAESGITVEALRFSVGRIERDTPAPLARKAPRPIALPADLQRQVDGIRDEGLREALGRAASVSLGEEARRRKRGRE